MKDVIKNIQYDIYLIGLLILTFFSYTGLIQEYLMPLLVGIGVICIMAKKSVFYIIPIPFFIQMSFSDLRDNVSVTTTYTVIFAVLILIDVLRNRKITKKGYLSIPLLVLLGGSILTHINSPDLFTTFAGFMQVASVLGLYFYFINTVEKDSRNYEYVAKLLMYMSALVTFEMIYFIYDSGDLAITLIRQRQIILGWENLNVIIYCNILSIPMIAYLVSKAKVKLPYMIFAAISLIGIFLTLSRSSILTVGVFVLLLVPIMLTIEKDRKNLIIQGLIFVFTVLIIIFYFEYRFSFFTEYIEAFQSRDLTYFDDRMKLLQISWEQFKMHPLFGSGGLYSSRIHLSEFQSLNYHNTIAQASTLGIVGLAGFIYLFYRKTKLIMSTKSTFKWYVLVLIYVTAFVNGMLQPMYFYTTYMVFIFLILAIVEVNENGLFKGNNK